MRYLVDFSLFIKSGRGLLHLETRLGTRLGNPSEDPAVPAFVPPSHLLLVPTGSSYKRCYVRTFSSTSPSASS